VAGLGSLLRGRGAGWPQVAVEAGAEALRMGQVHRQMTQYAPNRFHLVRARTRFCTRAGGPRVPCVPYVPCRVLHLATESNSWPADLLCLYCTPQKNFSPVARVPWQNPCPTLCRRSDSGWSRHLSFICFLGPALRDGSLRVILRRSASRLAPPGPGGPRFTRPCAPLPRWSRLPGGRGTRGT
jgi:hypothetical protein